MVFTTIQKFAPETAGDTHPVLSDRRNVVVVADEAHRSQYGFQDGYAKHLREALPGATYLGFTGTPIESQDKSTRSVFGDYIDVYDLTRAVEDGATVPIFYESRLVKVALPEDAHETLDELADEITAEERLDLVARDLVGHWELRRGAMVGKAMVVTMSRRIAVELYERIVALRPEWHDDDPTQGAIKAMHTLYVDKPVQGAGLMQAIARVNRTFRDENGGPIVNCIGVATNLRRALAEYSPTDRDQAGVPIEQMVAVMQEKHGIVGDLLHAARTTPPCARPPIGWRSAPPSWTSCWPNPTAPAGSSLRCSP
ncbi:DEAD/DEAH box helicase family protein [Blastococcus brunescens]|uniref:DEAD/DEAH box helicase family protein n=1 Tax=Blastococcus brunescens TaxID=1564165 RepID=A0ABZ1BAF5_9ACTN|nr:DEAD/DEAH box helicase family protein [Blastococcus sp. BMG 8361]WRL67221.1 DEAD/DEAH box helicase family protein [Blastococcus sp. BMG 8361]